MFPMFPETGPRVPLLELADVRGGPIMATGRAENRILFERYLTDHPFATDAFRRFLSHVERLFGDGEENEQDALGRGWF